MTCCGPYLLHPCYDCVNVTKADSVLVLVGPSEGSAALQNVACAVRSRVWEKCTKVIQSNPPTRSHKDVQQLLHNSKTTSQ